MAVDRRDAFEQLGGAAAVTTAAVLTGMPPFPASASVGGLEVESIDAQATLRSTGTNWNVDVKLSFENPPSFSGNGEPVGGGQVPGSVDVKGTLFAPNLAKLYKETELFFVAQQTNLYIGFYTKKQEQVGAFVADRVRAPQGSARGNGKWDNF